MPSGQFSFNSDSDFYYFSNKIEYKSRTKVKEMIKRNDNEREGEYREVNVVLIVVVLTTN